MKPLTEVQSRLLDWIREYQREHGYSPCFREICSQFGWSSTNAAKGHLHALERKGAIRRPERRARAIVIVKQE